MYLNKILILQKRALHLLFFADVHDHAIPFFLEANVLPITFLYHECVASFMYDTNSKNAPINMLHLFTLTFSVTCIGDESRPSFDMQSFDVLCNHASHVTRAREYRKHGGFSGDRYPVCYCDECFRASDS